MDRCMAFADMGRAAPREKADGPGNRAAGALSTFAIYQPHESTLSDPPSDGDRMRFNPAPLVVAGLLFALLIAGCGEGQQPQARPRRRRR